MSAYGDAERLQRLIEDERSADGWISQPGRLHQYSIDAMAPKTPSVRPASAVTCIQVYVSDKVHSV